ncbi:triose-phosphate isomerase [Thermaurantiacus sp.]
MQLIAGNWKMNGLRAQIAELEALIATAPPAGAALLLCPPATLVHEFARKAAGSHVRIGGQDCHWKASGPHTGDVSAAMLADAGASHVILGHSERRAEHGETDATVKAKAEAAQAAGLVPIICVGETLAEREAGQTFEVVGRQLRGSCPDSGQFVIAYEPVWAIGTGLTPAPDQVEAVHKAIAAQLKGGRRILYGGSVNPSNAALLLALPSVDGALVGGASLKARDFLAIAAAARAA